MDLLRNDLANIPQLSDIHSNDAKNQEVRLFLTNKRAVIDSAEETYGISIGNIKEQLRDDLKAKNKATVAFKMAESKSQFLKNIFAKDDKGVYSTSLDDLSKGLTNLTDYELPLITCKINAYKDEMSHRIRLLEERCIDLLEEAIEPEEEVEEQIQESQNVLDWDEPVTKKIKMSRNLQ